MSLPTFRMVFLLLPLYVAIVYGHENEMCVIGRPDNGNEKVDNMGFIFDI